MDSFDAAIDFIKERRQRILEGKINCIPSPFKRYSTWFPGIEKARYIIISASQKVGKSKLADFLCIYSPLFYNMEHEDQLKFRVLYFTLEMSKEEKYYDFLCHLLFKLDKIRIGTVDLKSTNKDKPLPKEILDKIESEKYQKYIRKFKECVTFIDDIKNPTGINKFCREYALNNGTLYKKTIHTKDENGVPQEREIVDRFEWNDPDCYYMILMDNYSNIMAESNLDKRGTIEKMSKYFITLRDQLKYSIIAIQHQAQDKEGIESIKLNRLYPTSDGLADCKTTVRDIDMLIGLYSPFKYGLKEHEKYDITKFQNNIRFMQILEDRNNGGGGQVCPLYFDGAVSEFYELPLPDNKREVDKVLEYIEDNIRKKSNPIFLLLSKGNEIFRKKFYKLIY
nr:MAG TPA: Helicase ATPase REPLICATION [Caudoviricetes sp.]